MGGFVFIRKPSTNLYRVVGLRDMEMKMTRLCWSLKELNIEKQYDQIDRGFLCDPLGTRTEEIERGHGGLEEELHTAREGPV